MDIVMLPSRGFSVRMLSGPPKATSGACSSFIVNHLDGGAESQKLR
jgi:hypothetical protein